MKFNWKSHQKSLFAKIISSFLTIILIILVTITSLIYFGVKHFIYTEDNIHLNHETLEIKNIILEKDGFNFSNFKKGDVDSDFYFKVYDTKESLLFNSDPEYKEDFNTNNKLSINKTVPISINNNLIGYLRVTRDMSNEYLFLRRIFYFIVFINVFSILIILIIGKVFSRTISKPLNFIEKDVQNISESNLKNRIALRGTKDEYDRLAISINLMLNRIQEAYESQKRYSSDISHELRTPLAVIKGYTDMLNKWGKSDKNILDEGLSTIKKETDNMINMVERLLFLYKSENIESILTFEKFDIKNLIDEILSETKLINSSHKFINKGNSCIINGDIKFIKQMIRALLDNSIKYTDKNGEITLGCDFYDNKHIFYIKDNGIGIPKDKIKYIFDRFYRINEDRNKNTGGNGLGLSIVKTIVDAHNGKIEVDSVINEGTTIKIEF
ncbi:MAG: HAMP domain-containing histidine kinase [Fusobacteriaceae bacterium]|nr:HAMP domain-containing histidine kinase [Fusobacteriaceae bacterium]